MPPINIVHCGTDAVAAWSTFAAALLAFAGVAVAIVLARKERRDAYEKLRTGLLRQQRVVELLEITKQYALYQAIRERRAASKWYALSGLELADEQARVGKALKCLVTLMPEGMVTMLKSELGVELEPKDQAVLAYKFPKKVPPTFSEDQVLRELRENMLKAGWGTTDASTKTGIRAYLDRAAGKFSSWARACLHPMGKA